MIIILLLIAVLIFRPRWFGMVFLLSAIIVCIVIMAQPIVAPEDCHATPIIQDQCP